MARPEVFKTPLGRRLADMRKEFGFDDRKGFASDLGLKPDTLGTYERGVAEPSTEFLALLHQRFGVSLTWLITGEGSMLDKPAKAPKKPVKLDAEFAEQMKQMQDTIEEIRMVTTKAAPRPTSRLKVREPSRIRFFPDHQVSAGFGRAATVEGAGEELDIDEMATRVFGVPAEQMLWFPIVGESMFPTFVANDIAIANRRHQEIDEDLLYVIALEGELFVKRAHWEDDGALSWLSDNTETTTDRTKPRYPPITLPRDRIPECTVIGRVDWMINALRRRY